MASLKLLRDELCSLFMCYSADKATLLPAVLSCRRFHVAYGHNKALILRQIRRNILGGDGAIGPMLRRIRVETELRDNSVHQDVSFDQLLDRLKSFEEDTRSLPTADEYQLCLDSGRLCDQLEVLYSRLYKDRLTRETSRLSGEESGRFCAAIHRPSLLAGFLSPAYGLRRFSHNSATCVSLLYGAFSPKQLYDLHHGLGWLATLVQELQAPQSKVDSGTQSPSIEELPLAR